MRRDCDIKSPKTLTLEAQKALEKVSEALKKEEEHLCSKRDLFSCSIKKKNATL